MTKNERSLQWVIAGIFFVVCFAFFQCKSRKTKRDGCEKRNAFIETKTKCASNLIRKVTAYLQNQSKTPSLYIKINGIQMDF